MNKVKDFKVGDKVKIVDCIYGHKFEMGDVVTIVMSQGEESFGEYKVQGKNECWYVAYKEIELVKEVTSEEI